MIFDPKTRNEKREIFQKKCVELSLLHRHLLIEAPTGIGKGRGVMKCIEASSSEKKWIVLCPEIVQVENFKKDLEKHGMTHLLMDGRIADVICYASFKEYIGGEYNLALNECHRLSELREDIAKSIRFDQIISDSATVPSDVKRRLKSIYPYHEYKITFSEAIAMGVLPEPRITMVEVELDSLKRDVESFYMRGKKKVPYLTSRKQKLKDLDKEIEYWRERYENSYENWILNKIKNLGSQRKRFISECKTEKAKELLSMLSDKKLVCFTGSVDQAIELGGGAAVHSKKTAKRNKEIIDKFNSGEIQQIFANRMMREGMNLDSIEAGIIVQLDSGDDEGLNFIQMCGRTMRAEAPEIFILYAPGTQDEKYTRKALSVIDKRYIKESIKL